MSVIGPDSDRVMTPGMNNKPNSIPIPAIAVTVWVHLPDLRCNNSSNWVNTNKNAVSAMAAGSAFAMFGSSFASRKPSRK